MLGWNETHRSIMSLAVIAVASSIVGCGDDLYEPRLVNSASEAATFHLTDDAIIPYADIRTKLYPDFKLGTSKDGKTVTSPGDGALMRVLPTTGYYEQQVIQALSAALAIRLPTTTTSDETKTTSKDGKTEVTVNNTTTYASGTVPTVEDLKKGQAGANPQAMTKIEALKTDDEKRKLDQLNPLLQYNLAAALVQEVAMLNTALDYLESVNSTSYDTYLLRLRVAVSPLAPNQPYNAYVALGFFCIAGTPIGEIRGPDYERAPEQGQGFVKVHPLLVMDDLESTSTARSAQLITQLSVAITGMLGSTGFGGLFNSDRSKIRTLLGKDLNSTYSISRTADNAVSVRLGAPRQPTAGYAMVNRNHAVSVVLQAPKGETCPFVNITFAASLRDANTSELVPDPLEPVTNATKAALHRFLESYATDKGKLDTAMKRLSDSTIRPLTRPIRNSDYSSFYDYLRDLLNTASMSQAIPSDNEKKAILISWRSLWGRLAQVLSLSPYQSVTIALPKANPSKRGPAPSLVRQPRDSGPAPGSPTPKIFVPQTKTLMPQ